MIPGVEYDQYEAVEELVSDLEENEEIEFSFNGVDYGILPMPDGYYIYQANKPDTQRRFDSIDAMLDGYLIEGKPVRAMVTQMEVTNH